MHYLFSTRYINKEMCAYVCLETKKTMFEIAISAEGKEYFFYNCIPMIGFPLDGNIKNISKIYDMYNKYKDRMQGYCISLDRDVYCELRDAINT